MRYLQQNKLYCFSPPVMLATFIIEISLAVYVVWRYGLTAVTKVAVLILLCLAAFQLAEFNVCEGAWGLSSIQWAKLGYVAITLLPPLGVHLIANISGDTRRWPVWTAYGLGAAFIAYFLIATNSIQAEACLGNYVIFEQGHGTGQLFGLYYYGLLLAAVGYAVYRAKLPKTNKNIKKSLYALVVGYSAFIIPTTAVNIIDPSTIAGIPSIMCGFAVILAVVLAGAVIPLAVNGKKSK